MNRKRLKLNMLMPMLSKVFSLVYSFVIPRLYISTYGSNTNGLVSSIGNFLSILVLLDMGIGAVVQASLYKPLLEGDDIQLSRVVKSSRKFFGNISLAFFVYTLILSFVYPTLIKSEFDFYFEFLLVLIVAIDSYSKTYAGYTNNLLVTADQKVYLLSTFQIISTIFSFTVSFLLIKFGISICFVLFASALMYTVRPLLIKLYVEKNYKLDKHINIDEEPIKQKWNGIAQNLAYFVTNNTDVFVLTVLSTLANVSIYSVYSMVVSGISRVIETAQSGVPPMLGRHIAADDSDGLKNTFETYEFISHSAVTFVYSCTLLLIVPFVRVYTKSITDADYIQPIFAVLITLAVFYYTLRQPYHSITIAAGHFKQTQTSSIIEMLLNVILTLAAVYKFGLPGVAFGTLVSVVYRTAYLVWYLPKISGNLSSLHSLKLFAADAAVMLVSYLLCRKFTLGSVSYLGWLIMAVKVSLVVLAVAAVLNLVVNGKEIKGIVKLIRKKRIV